MGTIASHLTQVKQSLDTGIPFVEKKNAASKKTPGLHCHLLGFRQSLPIWMTIKKCLPFCGYREWIWIIPSKMAYGFKAPIGTQK